MKVPSLTRKRGKGQRQVVDANHPSAAASHMRSTSFRQSSGTAAPLSPVSGAAKNFDLPPLSPDGGSVNEVYRRQAVRLDELEKENKRLAKELEVAESRWRKTEVELEDLREESGQAVELKAKAATLASKNEEIGKLV